jgi:hypothetical protein
MALINMARPKRRQLSMYLDEGIATLASWAKYRGLVIRDVVPHGSEPGFPKYAEKYQARVYYRITDLDEYFSDRPSVTGITMKEAKAITNKFLNILRDTDNVW